VSGPGGVGASVYTFVAALDNTQWGQVLIGASVGATCQNLADAINTTQSLAGLTFSLPTWENPVVNASVYTSTTMIVQNKPAGAGYIASLAASSSAFSWSGSATSGGSTSGATYTLSVAAVGSSNTANVYFTPGSNVVTLPSLPAGASWGANVQIAYTRYAGDCIVCENTADVLARAAAEGGTGKYQQLVSDTSNTSNTNGLQECQATLAAFLTPPIQFSFTVWKPGLMPGQLITLDFGSANPTGLAALVNSGGPWLVQEVSAELVKVPKGLYRYMNQTTVPGGGHYKYTVTVINAAQIFGYLEFWQGLGGGGNSGGLVGGIPASPTTGGGGGSSSNIVILNMLSPANASVTPDASKESNYVLLTADLLVAAPINFSPAAGQITLWQFIFVQDSAGGHSVGFDASYNVGFTVGGPNAAPNSRITLNLYTDANGYTWLIGVN
jgi:hypothetical protein